VSRPSTAVDGDGLMAKRKVTTHVAFLRAINVAGHASVKMIEQRPSRLSSPIVVSSCTWCFSPRSR
jgi:hypothetical protein